MSYEIKQHVTSDIEEAKRKLDELNSYKNKTINISIELENINVLLQQLEELKLKADQITIKPPDNLLGEFSKISGVLEELNKKTTEINTIMEAIGNVTASSSENAKKLGDEFESIGNKVGKLGIGIAKNIFDWLKNATLEGAKLNREMENGIGKIRTMSNINKGQLKHKVFDITKNYGVEHNEVTEGLYQISKAVGDINEKFEILDVSSKLAIAGFTNIGEASGIITEALKDYSLEMGKADETANIFIKTQKLGRIPIQEFSESLSQMRPIAQELNMGIGELSAALITLTQLNMEPSEANIKLTSFLSEVENADSKINEIFQNIRGISAQTFFNTGGDIIEFLKILNQYEKKNNIDISSQLGNKDIAEVYSKLAEKSKEHLKNLKEIKINNEELTKASEEILSSYDSRIKRTIEYTNEFKNMLGDAYNSIVANIGDLITGHDESAAAQKRLNNETETHIGTIRELSAKVEELGGVEKLTQEEQNRLNESLNSMKILAPDIYNIFLAWTSGAITYAEALKEVAKRQREISLVNSVEKLKDGKEQAQKKESEISSIKLKYRKLLLFQTSDLESDMINHPSSLSWERLIESNEFKKLLENPQLKEEYWNDTKNIEWLESGKKQIEEENKKLEVKISKQTIDLENDGFATWLDTIAKNDTDNDQDIRKSAFLKLEKENNKIEEDFKKKREDNNRKLENDLKKAKSPQEKLKMKQAFKKEETFLDIKEKIKKSEREIEITEKKIEIEKNLKNPNIESIEKSEIIISDLKRNISNLNTQLSIEEHGLISSPAFNNSIKPINSSKKSFKDSQETELAITNEYLAKRNQLTKEHNEQVNTALKEGNINLVNQLEEEYKKALNRLSSEEKIALLQNKINNSTDLTDLGREKLQLEIEQIQQDDAKKSIEEEYAKKQKENTESMKNLNVALENLAEVIGLVAMSQTGSNTVNSIGQIVGIGGSILNGLSQVGVLDGLISSGGTIGTLLNGASSIFGNITKGAKVGSVITGILGGGEKGNLGNTIGSIAGGLLGGGVGSVIGGTLGSITGSLFGRKSQKKAEREMKRYKKAQEALQKAQSLASDDWNLYMKEFSEQLQRRGASDYISMYDKLINVQSLSKVTSALEGNQLKGSSKYTSGNSAYGIKMDTLRDLLPQYSDKEIMDWFAGITGGAVQNGEYLETGQGKYGVFDLDKLADEIAKINQEFAAQLKQEIKEIINFTAENIASVVKEGFGEGLDDLGNNLEKQIAESLKSAFLNTQLFKDLSNGFSDYMSDYITDLFKSDSNLGIDMTPSSYSTPLQYIEVLKQYAEFANDKMAEIFGELGLSIDNLTGSVDTLNANLSANQVQGMATNLWKYNAGQDPAKEFQQDIVVNVMIDEDAIKKQTIKYVTDSLSKQRRGGYS